MFGDVQAQVVVTGPIDGHGQQIHRDGSRYPRVRIIEDSSIEFDRRQDWRDVVPRALEAGDERTQGSNGEECHRPRHMPILA